METAGNAPGPKGEKRPRDPNQLGKLIVDLSVGEAEDVFAEDPPKTKPGRPVTYKKRAENSN